MKKDRKIFMGSRRCVWVGRGWVPVDDRDAEEAYRTMPDKLCRAETGSRNRQKSQWSYSSVLFHQI